MSNLKPVEIYVKIQYKDTGGRAGIAYCYKGRWKTEYIFDIQETTANRCIILAVAHAIKTLKEPCDITVYTFGSFGIKKMYQTSKTWVNRDVGNKLLNVIQEGKHQVKNVTGEYGEEDVHIVRILNKLDYELSKRSRLR